MNERYVLSTRFTGLGDRLICLAAAWLYARDTGRSLVVDWRFGGLTEDSANAFPLCFCPASKLSGVPFYANIAAASLPKPRFPELWNQDVLVKLPFLRPSRHIFADRDLAVDLIRERQRRGAGRSSSPRFALRCRRNSAWSSSAVRARF
jgi:Nodulation protein Z (NodZ)/Xyloglucan fucosyltransferase